VGVPPTWYSDIDLKKSGAGSSTCVVQAGGGSSQ
jgi:hypothetical protein